MIGLGLWIEQGRAQTVVMLLCREEHHSQTIQNSTVVLLFTDQCPEPRNDATASSKRNSKL